MTTKKKLPLSETSSSSSSSGQQSADYVVGQVSGSLFQKTSSASGSLSGLFGSASSAPDATLLFQPVPETKSEVKEQQDESPEVKGQPKQTRKQQQRSEAEENLDNRENALQKADEDEQDASTKKKKTVKRTRTEDIVSEAELWVKKRQRTKSCRDEEEDKSKRTVFVGNLPVNSTKKTLRSLFRDKGNIESVRFRSVVREDPSMSRKVAVITRKIHPKKPSVNAYVVFKDEGGVANALERNGVEIEKDFVIRVDRVTDSSQHDHKRSVFVGNLSFEISDLVFRRHFEACGSVEAVRLIRDKNSGLGKGFGYVLFESADAVMLALELDGSALDGRSIRVKRSVKKEKQKKSNSDGGAATRAGPGRGGTGRGRGSAHGPMRGAGRGRGVTATPGRGRGSDHNAMRGAGRSRGGSAHGAMRGTGRGRGGSAHGAMRGNPMRGGGRGRGGSAGRGFKSQGSASFTSPASFRGQMVDPNKKMKKKERVKRKPKPNKDVHI